MQLESPKSGLNIFATCPQSKDVDSASYAQRVADVARWSEQYGCKGILVYTDNGIVDPWIVSNIILQNTEQLCPLIAVQPVYMSPYTVAKMISTYGYLYHRKVYLNMVAGGFRNDLLALNDKTPHDERYTRLAEYTLIIRRLLESPDAVTFSGDYYRVHNLKMTPPLSPELMPGILMSGSSDAGQAVAKEIGATAIKYPQRTGDEAGVARDDSMQYGVRVGVIARETAEEAWSVAHERFPIDRKGQVMHKLAMKISDSQWHKQLSEMAEVDAEKDDPYWLGPFENYKTFCPYLVGSYERVAEEVARYIELGYETFILDIPPSEEALHHTSIVFQTAMELQAQCQN